MPLLKISWDKGERKMGRGIGKDFRWSRNLLCWVEVDSLPILNFVYFVQTLNVLPCVTSKLVAGVLNGGSGNSVGVGMILLRLLSPVKITLRV